MSKRTPAQDIAAEPPLVFISHDTRDADVAAAFGEMLKDASGGRIAVFRSSDRTGSSGIESGADWYETLMTKLLRATHVVALFTVNSIGSPWMLYEAGAAHGRSGVKVVGLALGVPLAAVSRQGPFGRFQNVDFEEESLTTLVLELIGESAGARQSVRHCVRAFMAEAGGLLPSDAFEKLTPDELLDYLLETVPLSQKAAARDRLERSENMLIRYFFKAHHNNYTKALSRARAEEVLPLASAPRMEAAREAIDEARERVRAISILKHDQWHLTPHSPYLRANIEAATRGATIHRILGLQRPDEWRKKPETLRIIREQVAAGVQVRWVLSAKVERSETLLRNEAFHLVNVLITDERVMTRSNHEQNHDGKLILNHSQIKHHCLFFENLWNQLEGQEITEAQL